MRLLLSKALYSRAALEAAALDVGEKAQVYVEPAGKSWSVDARGDWRAFLDAALSHVLRGLVLKVTGPLAAAAAASALERGLAPQPADPLEELEPQVRADRRAETEALLEQARKL